MVTSKTTTQFILSGPISVGNIVSNAWRLYRLNFRTVILYILFPVVALALILVFLMSDEYIPLMFSMLGCLIRFPIMCIGFVLLTTVINFRLARAFCNIVNNQTADVSEVSRYIKKNVSTIFKFCGLNVVELMLFIILDVLLFIAIGAPLMFLMTWLESIVANTYFADIFYFLSFLFTLGYFHVFVYLFASQLFFCTIQLVSIVVEDLPVKYSLVKSFDLVYHNWFRFIMFVVLLYTLCFFLYLSMYILFYGGFAVIGTLISESLHNEKLTDYLVYCFEAVDIIGFTLIITLIWPFIISGATLFYYDAKARSEGIDLHQALSKNTY